MIEMWGCTFGADWYRWGGPIDWSGAQISITDTTFGEPPTAP